MKIHIKIFLLVIFISINGNVFSQPAAITLEEAIAIALKNNYELINARLDKQKAENKVSEVYADNLIPEMSLTSRYTRSFKKQVFDFAGQKIEVGTDNSFTSTIDIKESIPVLGTPVFTGIRIAKYFTQMEDEKINTISSKAKTDVKKSFLNVLLSKEVIAVNQESLENSIRNLNVVEIRYRNGVATEFDYLRAKVKVENLRPVLSQSINNLEISKKLLLGAMGVSIDQNIDVIGSLSFDTLEIYNNNLSDIIAENNSVVRQLRINKKINEEFVNVDKANFLPKLSLFGQYTLQASENDSRSISDYRFFNTVNAGISLSWNLNMFANSYRVDQSKVEVRKTEELIENMKRNLKIQSENILLRLEDARNRIIAQRETVITAERGLELAEISFRNGVINQIDVLDAELSLSMSRLAYLQAIYDYAIAKAELENLLEN
jgi:outer membrane protein